LFFTLIKAKLQNYRVKVSTHYQESMERITTSEEKIAAATAWIQERISVAPAIGIVLGTGLRSLVEEVAIEAVFPYSDIPYFPQATVESHHGRLILGELSGKPVVLMQGRLHYYEGYSMQELTLPIRVMHSLGAHTLLLSNAAGALNPDYSLSELMLLSDHINLLPENPLRGANLDAFGPRFPDMSCPYDVELRKLLRQIASRFDIQLHSGVYASVQGPNLETPAEYNMLRVIGADAVGMSTVPEVIVARHMRMRVLAVSVITDLCYPGALREILLEDVLLAARQAEPALNSLFMELVANL
jgi:purine-nucleoside phosphorylase